MKYLRSQWERLPEVGADPLPELDVKSPDFTIEKLVKLSNNFRSVVVLRNAFTDSNSVRRWSRDYLTEKYGDQRVVIREVWGDKNDNARMQRHSLKRFYEMMDEGRNVSIVASSIIFVDNPELNTDLESCVEDDLLSATGEILTNQVFSTPGGRSWYHAALGNNIFRQVAGQKRWTVISPEHNFYMCPRAVVSGSTVSPICLHEMNVDERELWVKRIPRQTALLNPGDILINAPWWWHDVQSIGEVDMPQFSVAGRVKGISAAFENAPLQTAIALFTRLRSKGLAGRGDNQIGRDLENDIVESWYDECVKRGGLSCEPDP